MNIANPHIASDGAAPLLSARHGTIAVATLNRPDARNALSEEMMAELTDLVGSTAAYKSIAALVIAARGPAFCAGHDLKQLTGRRTDADGGRAYFRQIMTS